MKENGIVQDIKGDEVLVRLKRHVACLGCRTCSFGSNGDMIIKAIASDRVNPVRDIKDTEPKSKISNGVKAGDRVTIEIDSIFIIKAIILVYLLPAIAFLVGIFTGLRMALLLGVYKHKEIFSIVIGVVLLSATLFLAKMYGIRKSGAYQARIINRASQKCRP